MKTSRSLERGTPVSFDMLEKGAILFATNNDNTEDLFRWLAAREEKVYKITNKLTPRMVRELEPAFLVSFNYRHIISGEVLDMLAGRAINLHTSLLPYNRGSSPNFFSFLEDTPKGVTIHLLDRGLDTGDILCRKEVFFDEKEETFASSYDRLLEELKSLFRDNWDLIREGRLQPVKQEGEGSCHRLKELEAVREQTPFDWNDKIADFKERYKGKDI